MLENTEQAPRFLYIRGKKALLHEKRTVALVGSRQASEKAKENTVRLARALGRNGITVVSGLAKGIDVTAHKAALESGFNTIAVIGTNLNQYYPRENKEVQLEKATFAFSYSVKRLNLLTPKKHVYSSHTSVASSGISTLTFLPNSSNNGSNLCSV